MASKKLEASLVETVFALLQYDKKREAYLDEVKAYDEEMGEEYRFAKAIIQHIIGRRLD
tara:strand:+ start:161 stop:337 length:177 start_codon:yes stop_codon:yes gene_type:complete